MRLNLGPDLRNGSFHLSVVPVCSHSTEDPAVPVGVFDETVQSDC